MAPHKLFSRCIKQAASFSTAASSVHTKRLEGKVAIVTGGSSGIGAAAAKIFAAQGAKVVIADIQDGVGESFANQINAHYARCDVSKESQVAATVDLAVSKYGRLDIMFNNAGIVHGPKPSASISELDVSELDALFNVNVKGVAFGMKHAARVMIPQNSGSIISTSSVAHLVAGFSFHPYTISKHAVFGMTRSAACELAAFGIRVNCISPAGVNTNIVAEHAKVVRPIGGPKSLAMLFPVVDEHDLRQPMIEAEEIANAALFLATDESKYVSGLDLVIDGSLTTATGGNLYKLVQQGLFEVSASS